MVLKHFLWIVQCLLFSLAGIIISGRLADHLNPLIWWALHQNGTTSLQRAYFIADYYLLLIGIYGFCLGLIPVNRLKELVAAAFAKIGFRPTLQPELVFDRPLLWAWVPVGLVFAFHFVFFSNGAHQSVLGSTAMGESRLEHFFGPLSARSGSNLDRWISDRFLLTGPTLFLLAYAIGVWLRHQYPQPPSFPPETPE